MSDTPKPLPEKIPAHFDNVLRREFRGESDRACVILAASLLDNALLSLLRARLVATPSATDSLLDGANAPLSTFSARIDMCYRLGVLSAKFTRDLHLVRKIRNQFAHNITGCSFEESSVRDRIQALANSSGYEKAHESWQKLFPDTPKGQFEFAIGWMQWYLREETISIESIPEAIEEWGYNITWDELNPDSDTSDPVDDV